MAKHETLLTQSRSKWCNTCSAFTQHRVDGGRVTRVCLPCQEKAEAEHQDRLAHPEPPAPVQAPLFSTFALTIVFLFVAVTSSAAQTQTEKPVPNFSTSSKIELSLAGLAIAGDAYTTRRFNDLGYRDRNFLARPFVSSNAGTVAYFGASFSGLVLSNRMLRTHPRFRHVMNWTVIGGETLATAYNAGFLAKAERRGKR